jgi:intergrase/recombinase
MVSKRKATRRNEKNEKLTKLISESGSRIAVIGDFLREIDGSVLFPPKDPYGIDMIYDPAISAELGMATYKPVSG